MLARERSSIPNVAPAQVASPRLPAEPGGQPGWLTLPWGCWPQSWRWSPGSGWWPPGGPTAANAPGRRPDRIGRPDHQVSHLTTTTRRSQSCDGPSSSSSPWPPSRPPAGPPAPPPPSIATGKYATNLHAAKADGYQIITRMIPDMGWHFLNPTIQGFDVTKPAILVYERHGRSWQLGALEWVFLQQPATPPLEQPDGPGGAGPKDPVNVLRAGGVGL